MLYEVITVLIFAREAATQVGATTMDRPEWVAVNPDGKSVCCTLTNNKYRGVEGKNQPVGGPNPRAKNHYGQIVRWWPRGDDHTAAAFDWDLFVVAGNPNVGEGLYAGSSNVTADNMFNSPDGLGFDAAGRLWILTDRITSYNVCYTKLLRKNDLYFFEGDINL